MDSLRRIGLMQRKQPYLQTLDQAAPLSFSFLVDKLRYRHHLIHYVTT